MKYKVRDKVRVRNSLIIDDYYNGFEFTREMKQFEGKEITINEVLDDYYLIKEDNQSFGWNDEMLEPIEERKGMKINEYQKAALRTAGTYDKDKLLLNGVLGLNGESGEVADIVKKNLFQGHDLDKEHIAKELGDVCWYIAITAEAIGYDLETIMEMNIEKLLKRYPNGFEVDRSINRSKSDI